MTRPPEEFEQQGEQGMCLRLVALALVRFVFDCASPSVRGGVEGDRELLQGCWTVWFKDGDGERALITRWPAG